MEQFLLEKANLKQVVAPGTDMNAAAITGARIGLQKGDRVAVLVNMGTSTGAVVDFSFEQHNAASGGTSKALEIDNPYYHKAGAATVFTKVQPTAKSDNFDLSALFAADGGIVAFEILAEDLDVNGGFGYVSLNVADSTAAKLIAAVYVLHKPTYLPAYDQAI